MGHALGLNLNCKQNDVTKEKVGGVTVTRLGAACGDLLTPPESDCVTTPNGARLNVAPWANCREAQAIRAPHESA